MMNFEAWFTLIASIICFMIGHRVYLLERKNKINIAFFCITFLILWQMIWMFELAKTSDEALAINYRRYLGVRPLLDVAIFYCLLYYNDLGKISKFAFLEKIVGPVLLLIGLGFAGIDLFSSNFYADIVLADFGWAYHTDHWTWLDHARGIFMLSVYLIAIWMTFENYRMEKQPDVKKWKMIVATCVLLSTSGYLLQIYFLPLMIGISPVNESLHFLVSIIFFGLALSDFKLLNINSEIAVENIVDSMTNLLFLTDNDFKIRKVNHASEVILDRKEWTLINQSFAEIFCPISWANCKKHIMSVEKPGDKHEHEMVFIKDEHPINLMMTITPILNEKEKKIGYAFVGTDMTKYRKAEKAAKAYAQKLEQSNEILERFAHIASHDLKEPLRTVDSFTKLLQQQTLSDNQGNVAVYFKYINESIQRMNRVIESTMEISKLNNSNRKVVEVDLERLVNRIQLSLSTLIEEKNAQINYGRLPKVNMDERDAEQLFQNLFQNALKYNQSAQPTIDVTSKETDAFYEIAVTDNGIGIDPQYHKGIFKMFKRLHNKREYEGTGIGLSLCAQIIDRYGGTIWVESDGKTGSTFKFTFPIDTICPVSLEEHLMLLEREV